jgi:hypothetical protein
MTTPTPPYTLRRLSSTEHQLVATRNIAKDEMVLREQPVVHVSVGHYRLSTYVWDMVDLLLADKSRLQQYVRSHLLSTPQFLDKQDLLIEAHLVTKYRKSRQFVRDLYFGVGTNNVGIVDDEMLVRAHGVFPLLSRTDHSCIPNCALTPGNWRAAEATLVAKHDISAGEPLTWCYFSEADFLPQNWLTRNYNLVNLYRFACRCPRCTAERPAEVPSDQVKQVAYLDKFIKEAASELARQADGMEQARAQNPINLHRERLSARINR